MSTNPLGNTTNASSFGPTSPFANDSGNAELGTSPGQTSAGTAVGNSGTAIAVGSDTLGINGSVNPPTTGIGTNVVGTGTNFVAPVDVGGGFVGGYGGGAAIGGGSSVTIAPAIAGGGSATPLLDQVTRNEQAREMRRRAEGREPRVIGIAPRTDVDRTDQMPDDRIIRY